MVFRWLKGRSAKGESPSETEDVVKPASGLGTIDLNPFGADSLVESVDEQSTVMMPELAVNHETEVWAALDDGAEGAEDTSAVYLSENEARSHSADAVRLPSTHPTHEGAWPPRFHPMPSLRREAMRLRYAIDSLQPESPTEEVSELWKSYLRLVPTDQNGWLSLGEFHLRRGELTQAELVFRTALEFQPKDALTSGALGHTLMEQGKYSDARIFLDVACQGLPEEIDLQESLLACLKSCGDTDGVKHQGMVIDELRRGAR